MVDYSKWDHIEVGICVINVLRRHYYFQFNCICCCDP